MTETGLLENLKRQYPVTDDTCEAKKKENTNARVLTLNEFGAAFVVLLAGIPTATSFLLLEIIIRKAKGKKGPGILETNE